MWQNCSRIICEVKDFWSKSSITGELRLAAIKNQPPALIVLDLMLPEISGLDLCRMIKSNPGTKNVPIVMLSARIEEIDRVLGFELGADDYVVKPFSPRELVLRIRAILRRLSQDEGEALLRVGDLVLDRSRHEVKAADRVIDCTATEFKLLAILMERQGRVQERDRLLTDVWGYDSSSIHGRWIPTCAGCEINWALKVLTLKRSADLATG